MAQAGKHIHLVQLEDRPDVAEDAEVMVPATLFVAIQQQAPSDGDENHVAYTVEGPFHAQVNTDTVLLWEGRTLFVLGKQDMDGRRREMRLYCHEVKTP